MANTDGLSGTVGMHLVAFEGELHSRPVKKKTQSGCWWVVCGLNL